MPKIKIKPCKECKSTDIEFWDCGCTIFNPGGGKCRNCNHEVQGEAYTSPTEEVLIKIWNKGQTPTKADRLKESRLKCRRLRAQLRKAGITPCE